MSTPEMVAHHFIAARLSGAHITDPAALPAVTDLDHAYEIQKVRRPFLPRWQCRLLQYALAVSRACRRTDSSSTLPNSKPATRCCHRRW